MRIAFLQPFQHPSPVDTLTIWGLHQLLKEHEIMECSGGTFSLNQDLAFVSGASLLDGKGTFVRILEAEGMLAASTTLIPLGLKLPVGPQGNPLRNEDELSFLRSLCRKNGGVSVADPFTEQWVNRWLGDRSAVFTGNPLLHLTPSPKKLRMPRGVFCPNHHEYKNNRLFKAVFESFWDEDKVLTLALEGNDLTSDTEPGFSTLHCPRYPEVIWEALSSATGILTMRLEPALLGCAGKIPVFTGPLGIADASLANWLGIPKLKVENSLMAARSLLEFWENYPHEAIAERVLELNTRMDSYLASLGVDPNHSRQKGSMAVPATPEILSVCCIANETYLPYLTGLVENLRSVHSGEIHLHALALDEATRSYLQEQYGFITHIYDLADLWDETELEKIRSRTVADRAYSSKPRLLLRALRETDVKSLLYCDLDLHFFKSPARLQNELGTASVLLFPHWNDRPEYSKMYGIFNAGMILVSSGAVPFLEWWSEMCLHYYNRDKTAGYWVDQGALDLAPVFFESVRVYRKGDENIAFWNIETLSPLERKGKIGSVHAAGPDRLGLFEAKFCWDQVTTFFSPLGRPRFEAGFMTNIFLQQSTYWREGLRMYYLHYFLNKLLPGSPFLVPRSLRRFFSIGAGRHLLDLCLFLYRHYRRVLANWGMPNSPRPDWISLQRLFISEPS